MMAQQIPFIQYYPGCLMMCTSQSGFPKNFLCPVTCMKSCLQQASLQSFSLNENKEIDDSDYICKLG
ncbi:unnamed protein product, partial [Thlaspi arvense]